MSLEIRNLQPLRLNPVHHQHDDALSPGSQTRKKLDPFAFPVHDSKAHLLLAATGSVATIKIPLIISSLSQHPNLAIRLIFTTSATQFLQGQSAEQPSLAELEDLPNVEAVYLDEDEWREPWVRGNRILHIELRRWADMLLVAPLSADALAKITGGWADSLVLSVVRAWDSTGELDPVRDVAGLDRPREEGEAGSSGSVVRKKKIIVAPSMNTAMWKQPITKKQVDVLEGEWGVKNGGWFEVLQPMEKELACGDVGSGAMRDWREIVGVIEDTLGLGGEGRRVRSTVAS
ncbi:phosphopantothenoylcysteine decarboxylase [Massariosphaeria phaeospora]|uniref:Phosphopantothenoylcysteine decarboxylase n=1 Tax=Massariosphaeria phaeospora TaxID=100035 RepID=A0A7C8I799_9PLEO|nr:phosphopantothenoylcysteine decarboxylase [Massariosphaeria phaeospora]